MSSLDTIFGFAMLFVGALVLRFGYMLFRLVLSDTEEITQLSGSFRDVFMGRVSAWVGDKRVPQVSAGMSYVEGREGGHEQSEGFVSDEVIIRKVRGLN